MSKKTTDFRGLTSREAEQSRKVNGKNIISRKKNKSFVSQFIGNLNDPIIRILLIAMVVNAVVSITSHGGITETVGIAVAVVLATLISTVSEYSSQRAFEKLNGDSDGTLFRVRRDGSVVTLPSQEIVVGDIITVSSGEIIPADAKIVRGKLTVDQSSLTGESIEIEKSTGEFEHSPDCRAAVFRGCAVLSGEADIVVTQVGDKTFMGEISREIQENAKESPLRSRLTVLAKDISKIGYVMAVLVAFAYVFNVFVIKSNFDGNEIISKFKDISFLAPKLLSAFTLALTVIVMAVPEGLPMMIAVVLASNLRKMAKDNVLVRKPVGIEAAGSMNILFTDKTGTLTEGQQTVGRLILGDGTVFDAPKKLIKKGGELAELFGLSCLFNTSAEKSDGKTVGGNSAERALLDAAYGAVSTSGYSFDKFLPFNSERKYSSATVSGKRDLTFIKGAPEKIIPKISAYLDGSGKHTAFDREKFDREYLSITKEGGRVLLIAYSEDGGELTLICAVELVDALKKEAKQAVYELHTAGVQVVMITGDSRETATGIAAKCGIISGKTKLCITSDEMYGMTDEQIKEILPELAVVARALPTDKSRLVRIAESLGLVVGMTGDGVNDAPALKHADVGFAMGSGTQVAKEAGDIIILDNNLSSIVRAVLYGRTVFKSIRKFITLQLIMNFCACGISMIGPFIGFDAPVTVVQMLWINLIMDTLGGLAFAGEPPRASYMKEKPKKRDEAILNRYMIGSLIFQGGFTLLLGVAFLKLPIISDYFGSSDGDIRLLTAFFAFFIFSSVFNCFAARTDRLNLFADLLRNKIFIVIMLLISAIQIIFIYLGGSILRTVPLTEKELLFTLAVALLVIPADIIRKIFYKLSGHKNGY